MDKPSTFTVDTRNVQDIELYAMARGAERMLTHVPETETGFRALWAQVITGCDAELDRRISGFLDAVGEAGPSGRPVDDEPPDDPDAVAG